MEFRFRGLYERLLLRGAGPALVVVATLAAVAWLASYLPRFRMDASTDSIVLQNDPDLRFYEKSRRMFGTDDYVAVVLTADSPDELFSPDYLKLVGELRDRLAKVRGVETLMSILDVPLFHSPDVPLMRVARDYRTLESGADPALARKELVENPLYSDYVVAPDGTATAIMIMFDPDREYLDLVARRRELLDKREAGDLSPEERRALAETTRERELRHAEISRQRREDIDAIRAILRDTERAHPEIGRIHLGGPPMMIADMIDYIESDIVVFGLAALGLMIFVLAVIHRSPRWVVLPISACLVSVLGMLGWLSRSGWATSVVSSNFSSLLMILTLSPAVHLASLYREFRHEFPHRPKSELVSRAVFALLRPVVIMVLTTIAGFGSLVASGIRPVMDFGLMMTWGLALSFLVCFVFLPAAMALWPEKVADPNFVPPPAEDSSMLPLAVFSANRPAVVAIGAFGAFAFFAAGIPRLSVEARFIDYFREATPIHESIRVLDDRMGGAMPLEIVLEGEGKDYWLEPANLALLGKVHDYVDSLPETDKVISPETMRRILEKVNGGRPLNKLVISTALRQIPEKFRPYVVAPYGTPDFDAVRIVIRVLESSPELQRIELRRKIEAFLNENGLKVGERAHVTGYFVLYNNMLRSLYESQIKTVSSVFLTVWLMFALLFRSAKLATIGLAPNVLAVTAILGTMGWLGVHLDMMTVMIAAVTFGLADDNTIHYLHRFEREFALLGNYRAALFRVHNTIGKPLSHTMVATVLGFGILALSNFIPTVYFGLFTGLAMFVAVLAAHTVLPVLLLAVRPFGAEREGATAIDAPGDRGGE